VQREKNGIDRGHECRQGDPVGVDPPLVARHLSSLLSPMSRLALFVLSLGSSLPAHAISRYHSILHYRSRRSLPLSLHITSCTIPFQLLFTLYICLSSLELAIHNASNPYKHSFQLTIHFAPWIQEISPRMESRPEIRPIQPRPKIRRERLEGRCTWKDWSSSKSRCLSRLTIVSGTVEVSLDLVRLM